MMISALIVEDEPAAVYVLQNILSEHCPQVRVLAVVSDLQSAIDFIQNKKPDLVFLDIHLHQSNAFEIFNVIQEDFFEVIFTSAYCHYALSAIKINALDYLVKPIDPEELINAVDKLIKKNSEYASLRENKKIAVHHQQKVEFIPIDSIKVFKAHDNYTEIITADNCSYIKAVTLSEIYKQVSDYKCFIRINRKIIIHLNHVKKYYKTSPFIIQLNSGEEFEISRRRKTEVLEYFRLNG